MKFFREPKNWKQEISEIALTAGTAMFLLSFLVLGSPVVWLLTNCILLLLPLMFGSWLKMKLPALILLLISGAVISYSVANGRAACAF